MITLTVRNFNLFSQSFYDSIINNLPFHQLTCSCGHSGCLTIHGYYDRSVKTPEGTVRLKICRVKCSECGTTHALLTSSIVPYSQIPLIQHCQIIEAYEQDDDPREICSMVESVDDNNVKSVLRSYRRHWREKLRAEKISLLPFTTLIRQCFALFGAQFMQIHRGNQILFQIPT